MSKGNRREQLLDLAFKMIQSKGTDALTLTKLAEEAKLTKPITYSHFQSKQNLLYALYRRYDEQLIQRIETAISASLNTNDTAQIIAQNYFQCVQDYGIEYEMIVSALVAYPEHQSLRHDMRHYFATALMNLFQPNVQHHSADLFYTCIAIWSAIENISLSYIADNKKDQEHVINIMVDIIHQLIQPFQKEAGHLE